MWRLAATNITVSGTRVCRRSHAFSPALAGPAHSFSKSKATKRTARLMRPNEHRFQTCHALCDLHSEVLGGRPRTILQLARRAARSRRGFHPQPAARRVADGARVL